MQVDDKGAPQLQTVTNDSDAPSPAEHDTAEGSSQVPPLLFRRYSKPSLNGVGLLNLTSRGCSLTDLLLIGLTSWSAC